MIDHYWSDKSADRGKEFRFLLLSNWLWVSENFWVQNFSAKSIFEWLFLNYAFWNLCFSQFLFKFLNFEFWFLNSSVLAEREFPSNRRFLLFAGACLSNAHSLPRTICPHQSQSPSVSSDDCELIHKLQHKLVHKLISSLFSSPA